MKIAGWSCLISDDGTARAASHPEGGSVIWINGRLVGHCDCPTEVVEWLLRPLLCEVWREGAFNESTRSMPDNPYSGEPLNKDHDPS